jgi:outer membrane protein assembly factor BamB
MHTCAASVPRRIGFGPLGLALVFACSPKTPNDAAGRSAATTSHGARREVPIVKAPGTPFLGSSNAFGDQDPVSQRLGHVTAVDADSGKVLWNYDADTSMVASVTPTAGGLVLTGDTKGNFIAFDARDGKVLLKKNLGDPIGGGIIT